MIRYATDGSRRILDGRDNGRDMGRMKGEIIFSKHL
jgi:hypothetical protein